MLTPSSTPNQIRSMPSLSADRRQQRHDDEGQLEEVEEEGEEEDQDVDDDQEAELAARQAGQQVLDPDVAVDAVEGQAEDARADQDEDHEGTTACVVESIACRSRLQAQPALAPAP